MLSRLIWVSALSAVLASAPAFGQGEPLPGDPGRNVNLVGPTPDPADIRDTGLKQQNEPACAVRPDNPACVICAYNDYRTVEKPADSLGNPIIGDAWHGRVCRRVVMSVPATSGGAGLRRATRPMIRITGFRDGSRPTRD